MSYKLVHKNILSIKADAIVNATNRKPVCTPGAEMELYNAVGPDDMLTVMWLLCDENFDKDKFIRCINIDQDIDLQMGTLTLREKMQLDKSEFQDHEKLAEDMGIDIDTVNQYYRYSKYIPEYTEVFI